MRLALLAAAALALAACSAGEKEGTNDVEANVSSDPFGATGAPGADMTDNGATDGSDDLQANAH